MKLEACGITLFRIEAARDIDRFCVKKGELGGYVEKPENLSGNARVSGNALEKKADCINIINAKYNVTILPQSIQIGCQYHTKKEWFSFSDREIIAMDGAEGLRWWQVWKPVLEQICKAVGTTSE